MLRVYILNMHGEEVSDAIQQLVVQVFDYVALYIDEG